MKVMFLCTGNSSVPGNRQKMVEASGVSSSTNWHASAAALLPLSLAALGCGFALLYAALYRAAGERHLRQRVVLLVLLGSRRYVTERREEFQALATEEPPVSARVLDRLEGRDVFLFIVESYGYTLYSEPAHFALAEPFLRRVEARPEGAGYRIASNFLSSPAFGGNSWLADSTLAAGVRIADQAVYAALLESEVKPMAARFNEAGYLTANSMSATTASWPEWATMTDQFAIGVIHRRVVIPVRYLRRLPRADRGGGRPPALQRHHRTGQASLRADPRAEPRGGGPGALPQAGVLPGPGDLPARPGGGLYLACRIASGRVVPVHGRVRVGKEQAAYKGGQGSGGDRMVMEECYDDRRRREDCRWWCALR